MSNSGESITKLLYFIPFPIVGGAEVQIRYLIKHLKDEIKVHVAYNYAEVKDFVASLGVEAYHIASSAELASLIKDLKIDVFHYYHSHVGYNALRRVGGDLRVVEVVHNAVGFAGDATSYPKSPNTTIICVSQGAYDYFIGNAPNYVAQTNIIYNGVDESVFYPAPSQRATNVIGFSGRLEEGDGKGIPKLLAIARDMPHIKLELLGKDFGGYSKTPLPNVRFLGEETNPLKVAEHYRRWRAFISASPAEGYGLSIAEAACCGTPVIAYNCGGVLPLLKDKVQIVDDSNVRSVIENTLSGRLPNSNYNLSGVLGSETMARNYRELYTSVTIKQNDAYWRHSNISVVDTALNENASLGLVPSDWQGVRRALSTYTTHLAPPEQAVQQLQRVKPKYFITGCYTKDWEVPLRRAKKMGCVTVLTWHAAYILNEFSGENRDMLHAAHRCVKEGLFDFVATPHKGLAETWTHFGIPTDYMPNVLHLNRSGVASKLKGLHIGVFGSGQPWKNVETQIIGAAMAGATVHVTRIKDRRALDDLGIKVIEHPGYMNDAAYFKLISQMTINLCVTLSEVYSYLTAESMALGVPVVGTPIIPIFREAPKKGYLKLCECPYFEDPTAICESIQNVLINYSNIIEEGIEHINSWNLKNRNISDSIVAKWKS